MRLFATKKNPYVPSRNKKELIQADLSGSKWSIEAPPASYPLDDFLKGPKINIYDHELYNNSEHLPEDEQGLYPCYCFFSRAFGLYGKPWQSEPLGIVDISAMIYHTHDLPASMSCFIPAHFEEVLLRYLYFSEGPGIIDFQERCAPVNWQQIEIKGVNYIYCEAHNDFSDSEFPPEVGEETHIACNYFTPIDGHHFLKYVYRFDGCLPVEQSLATMYNLKNEIVNSTRFDLSSNQKKLQQEAIKEHPKLVACKSRDPEKWIYSKFRYEDLPTGKRQKVMVAKASPPPAYSYTQQPK